MRKYFCNIRKSIAPIFFATSHTFKVFQFIRLWYSVIYHLNRMWNGRMKGGIIFVRFVTFNQSISTSKEIQTNLTIITVYWWNPSSRGKDPNSKNWSFWDKKLWIFGVKGAEIFEKMRGLKERSAILGIFRENLAKFWLI